MEEIAFYILSILAVISGILALEARDNIYAVLSLGSMMLDIAGIFILLNSYFLGLIQLIVYAGTVTILMIIAIMLVKATRMVEGYEKVRVADPKYEITTIILTLISLATIATTIIGVGKEANYTEISLTELAKAVFGVYWFVFVLVMFLVGAVIGGAFSVLRQVEVKKE